MIGDSVLGLNIWPKRRRGGLNRRTTIVVGGTLAVAQLFRPLVYAVLADRRTLTGEIAGRFQVVVDRKSNASRRCLLGLRSAIPTGHYRPGCVHGRRTKQAISALDAWWVTVRYWRQAGDAGSVGSGMAVPPIS